MSKGQPQAKNVRGGHTRSNTASAPLSGTQILIMQGLPGFWRVVVTTIRWGVALLIAKEFFDAIKAFAGKETFTSFLVTIFGELGLNGSITISIALSGFSVVWALGERSLRHRKVRYLQDRIVSLERELDPDRSSSGLTTSGRTNPEDA